MYAYVISCGKIEKYNLREQFFPYILVFFNFLVNRET